MKHDLLVFLHRLSGPQWWALGVALACHVGAVCLHTLAWRTILAHEYGTASVRWRTVFGGYAAGSALNAVVPARPGGLLKLYLIRSRIPGATYPALLATLVPLALFDAVVTIVIAAWAIHATMLPGPLELTHYKAFVGRLAIAHPVTTVVSVGVALLVLTMLFVRVRKKLYVLRRELARGVRVLRDPGFYAARVLPVQALNWLVQLASLGFFLAAFGLPATPRTVLVAQAAKSMAILIPFTPSGLGAQFALLMLAFGKRFPASVVSAFAIGMRAAVTLVNISLGLGAIVLTLRTLRWRRALERLSAGARGHAERRTLAARPEHVPRTRPSEASRGRFVVAPSGRLPRSRYEQM